MAWIPGRFNFFSPVPAPRCTSQRLPHLLRLLLVYQANPIPATPSRIIFLDKEFMSTEIAFLADFQGFLFANG